MTHLWNRYRFVGGAGLLFAVSLYFGDALSSADDKAQKPLAAEMKGHVFALPPANACHSAFDDFYRAEPGVYAFWALCESGTNPVIHDYAGEFDFDGRHSRWHVGTMTGGVAGPVKDGETALQVRSPESGTAVAQNFPVNRNSGTIAAWINSGSIAPQRLSSVPFSVSALHGHSSVALIVTSKSDLVCLGAGWHNSGPESFGSTIDGNVWVPDAKCGFEPNTWHRVVATWGASRFNFYVDGARIFSRESGGALDYNVFLYQLFTVTRNTTISVAKALVSNQAWSDAQAAEDYAANLPHRVKGGVLVTSRRLGTIHRDVLGYADNNADLSSPQLVTALRNGLKGAGVTAVRYANGFGGIGADEGDWRGAAVNCTLQPGKTVPAQNTKTRNSIDTYLPEIAKPLGLHIGYTVNYGTNPPACNAGGDPVISGADLVDYTNNKKHYGIRYWEIGNEVYSRNSEPDFHESPNTGSSYAQNEPAFYSAMKAKDPNISIAVPAASGIYDWITNYTLPVMANASYDAVVFHNYPIRNAISDGTTLYQDRVNAPIGRPRGALLTLQTMLLNVGKKPDAIWATEWNADVNGEKWSKQTMGAVMPMFATIQLAEYMRAGVQYATWWEQGMSAGCLQFYYDNAGESAYSWWRCGNVGLIYPGRVTGEQAIGLHPGDLTPAARAFQILSQSGFVSEGEHMLETITDNGSDEWVLSYAATHGAGSYAVILINRDRDASHVVPVSIEGVSGGNNVQQWSYGRTQYDFSRSGDWGVGPVNSTNGPWSGAFSATLPPWSVNVFIVK